MVANFKITAWGVVEVPATRVYPDHPLMRRDRRVSERGNVVNGRVVRTRNIQTWRRLGNWYQAAAPSALAHMAHSPKRTAPVSLAQSPPHASLSLEPNVLTRRHLLFLVSRLLPAGRRARSWP